VKCEVSTEAIFEDYDNPFRFLSRVKIRTKGDLKLPLLGGIGGGSEIDLNLENLNQPAQTHIGEAPTEQEAQTERMFKSTYRNFLDKGVEPSMFNANTIDHHYSLGEFFNRLTDPIFFYRVEYSELL